MGRRAKKEDEQSYDSVLDTMTNVVGILVIFVALTKVQVAGAGDGRGRFDGPDLTPEAVEVAKAQAGRMRAVMGRHKRRWGVIEGELPDEETDARRVMECLKNLEREAERPTPIPLGVAALQKTIDDLEQEAKELDEEVEKVRVLLGDAKQSAEQATPIPLGVAALQKTVDDLEQEAKGLDEEVEKVRVLLGDARQSAEQARKQREKQKPETLSLPAPDSKRAKGKKRIVFVCRGKRLYRFDDEGLSDRIWDGYSDAIKKRVKRGKFASWSALIDWAARHMRAKKITAGDFEARVRVVRRRIISNKSVRDRDLRLRFVLKKGVKGESLPDLELKNGRFAALLGKHGDHKHWYYFRVYDDSFALYLKARDLAERVNLPVGWRAWSKDEEIEFSLVASGGGGGWSPAPD